MQHLGAAIIPAQLRQPAQLTALPDLCTFIDRLGIRGIQVSLQRSDLWREAALLERLLYKNKHQHRGSHHFTKLQEVRPPTRPHPVHARSVGLAGSLAPAAARRCTGSCGC
jgi:hypothetical protein